MKKYTLLILMAVLLTGLFAGSVLAATDCDTTYRVCDTLPDTTGGAAGVSGLQFSPNVTAAYAGVQNSYAIGTYNPSGTKTYVAISAYSGLLQTKGDITDGAATTLPGASVTTWDSAVWAEVAK